MWAGSVPTKPRTCREMGGGTPKSLSATRGPCIPPRVSAAPPLNVWEMQVCRGGPPPRVPNLWPSCLTGRQDPPSWKQPR